jgi:hypothetical protein
MGFSGTGALGGGAAGAKIGLTIGGPVGAAIGGVGGLIAGGLLGGRKSPIEKAAEDLAPKLLSQLADFSKQDRQTSNQLMGMAMPALQNAGAYYNQLLNPNTTEALDTALGGQRAELTSGAYEGALKQGAEFGARGGGKVAGQNQSLTSLNAELVKLVANARGQAAAGLLSVGSQTGGLGANFAGQSSNDAQAALAAITYLLHGTRQDKAASSAAVGGIMEQIGGILSQIDWKSIGKSGNGGMTGVGSAWPQN